MNTGILVDIALFQCVLENEPGTGPWYGFGICGSLRCIFEFPYACWEDPRGAPMRFPLLPHQVQGSLRQWNIAIFISFTAADMDDPSGAVDIMDLKVGPFLKPETAGINGGETHPVSKQTHIG